MSKIRTYLTCGLMTASLTGCQMGPSFKESILGQKPVVPAENLTESAEKTELSESLVTSDGETVVREATLSRQVDKPVVTAEPEPAPELVTEAETKETEPEKPGRFTRFVNWVKRTDSKKEKSEEKSREQNLVTDAISDAKQTAELETSAKVEGQLGESVSDADALSLQIAELIDNKPESAPELDFEKQIASMESDSTSVEQIAAQDNSEVDAAFDLTSYADASVKKLELADKVSDKAKEKIKETTAISKEIAAEASSLPEWANTEVAAAVAKAAEKSNEEFPWTDEPVNNEVAVNTEKSTSEKVVEEKAEILVKETVADLAEETDADSAPIEVEVAAKESEKSEQKVVKETTPAISNDILQLLDEALGDTSWRNAGALSAVKRKPEAAPTSAELKQIAELLTSEETNLRIQGLRRAYERGGDSVLLSDVIAQMMKDSDPNVRAHAACTLYHWNQSIDEVTETLGEVVTCDDQKAVQLSAMYLGDMSRQSVTIVPILETALVSADGLSALYVAEAILKHQPDHVDAMFRLTSLMRNKDVQVRWLTAHTLGSVNGKLKPYAIEALRCGLRDIDDQVRCASALSLGGLGETPAIVVAELQFISAHAAPEIRDAANIALECLHKN